MKNISAVRIKALQALALVWVMSVLVTTRTVAAKKNELRVTGCQQPGEGNKIRSKHRCMVNRTMFNPIFEEGDTIDVDFGPGRRYKCQSQRRAGSSSSSSSSASCAVDSSGSVVGDGLFDTNGNANGNNKVIMGNMNVITRGKNARGEQYIFGSTSVDGEICDFSPNADGTGIVVECNPESSYPPEADAVIPTDYNTGLFMDSNEMNVELHNKTVTGVSGLSSYFNQQQHRDLVDDSGSVIDVMVVWTKKAECLKSGLVVGCNSTAMTENNMRGLIDLAVAETNTAFSASGVATQLRLVHAYREPNYVEATSNAFNAALSSITGTSDGVMDDVHAKRNLYGADIVVLIIDDPSYCGLAYMGPIAEYMFSVTKWSCATGLYTFGHEIGHNLGCNHDKGTENACSSSSFNYGWRDPNGDFRSILAYSCVTGQCDNMTKAGCTRVQRFSNTVNLYNGKAMGSPLHDNARQINSVKATVAAYRKVMIQPTTSQPITAVPPIQVPTSSAAPTQVPTSAKPSLSPSTLKPTTVPTLNPTSLKPTTMSPTSNKPTTVPTQVPISSAAPTQVPTSATPSQSPSTLNPTTVPTPNPSSLKPTTMFPTSNKPTTVPTQDPRFPISATPSQSPSTLMPTTAPTPNPTSLKPTTTMSPTSYLSTTVPTQVQTLEGTLRSSSSHPSTTATPPVPSQSPSTLKPTTTQTLKPTLINPTTRFPTPKPVKIKPSMKPSFKPTTKKPT